MRDFDFNPGPEKAVLLGAAVLPRAISGLKVWKRKPFDAGHALADLFVLANTESGSRTVRGIAVDYKPGWVLWSIVGLADRWGWHREKVRLFLTELEKSEAIKLHEIHQYGKVIELLDYVSGFATEPSADLPPAEHRNATEGEGDIEREREGGEERESGPSEIPSNETIAEFCRNYADLSLGISGIPEVWWTGWLSNRLSNRHPFPKDWARVLTLAFRSDWIARHPKALANLSVSGSDPEKNREKTGGGWVQANGQSVAQQRFLIDRELKAVRARLNAAHETGVEGDPEDQARESELEKMAGELV